MGAGIAASPHCAERRICRCSQLGPLKTRRPKQNPLSILAHQLRRRFVSNRSLLRGARPAYSTARPEGSLVVRPVRPALRTEALAAKTIRCSAALLGVTTLASRFAHQAPKNAGTASRERRSPLPAPLPG